jgi:hypothetical protein
LSGGRCEILGLTSGAFITTARRVFWISAPTAGLNSDPVEFDGIDSEIVEPLPDVEKFHSIAIPKPVAARGLRRLAGGRESCGGRR